MTDPTFDELMAAPTPESIVAVNLRAEAYDVYIGRGSKWGNPFRIGVHGTRAEVIRKYEERLRRTPLLMSALKELHGQRLGCFCKPQSCHGDVLRRVAIEVNSHQR